MALLYTYLGSTPKGTLPNLFIFGKDTSINDSIERRSANYLIRERTQAGLQAARARGRKGKRWQKLTTQQIEIGRSLASDSTRSVTSICEHLGISRPTYYRHISPKVASLLAEPKLAT